MAKRKLKKSNFIELEKERIKLLYKEGYSIMEIVNQTEFSYSVVETLLKKEGLIKKKQKQNVEPIVTFLFKDGKSVEQIAYELKMQPNLIGSLLINLGLLKRKKRLLRKKDS